MYVHTALLLLSTARVCAPASKVCYQEGKKSVTATCASDVPWTCLRHHADVSKAAEYITRAPNSGDLSGDTRRRLHIHTQKKKTRA